MTKLTERELTKIIIDIADTYEDYQIPTAFIGEVVDAILLKISQALQSYSQEIDGVMNKTLTVPIKKEEFSENENWFEKWKLEDDDKKGVEPCYECSNGTNIRTFIKQKLKINKKWNIK